MAGMLEKTGLVLEGGGMRGVFTAGVLDCLLDEKIYFPYVVGVSAGASNGLSYASRQRGRAHFCNIEIQKTRPYIGFRYMLSQGCAMDYDFMFGELPKSIYPYDFGAYMASGRFVLVATNCLTGKAEYFEKPGTMDELLRVCRASCSMPYVTTIVDVGGVPYLDGGVVDAIPLARAQADGFQKNVVVLTRNKGYRKHEAFPSLMSFIYRRYPNFRAALKSKNDLYNKAIGFVEDLEGKGEIFVIRPQKDLRVNRLERNCGRLEALYREGYNSVLSVVSELKDFIGKR